MSDSMRGGSELPLRWVTSCLCQCTLVSLIMRQKAGTKSCSNSRTILDSTGGVQPLEAALASWYSKRSRVGLSTTLWNCFEKQYLGTTERPAAMSTFFSARSFAWKHHQQQAIRFSLAVVGTRFELLLFLQNTFKCFRLRRRNGERGG